MTDWADTEADRIWRDWERRCLAPSSPIRRREIAAALRRERERWAGCVREAVRTYNEWGEANDEATWRARESAHDAAWEDLCALLAEEDT